MLSHDHPGRLGPGHLSIGRVVCGDRYTPADRYRRDSVRAKGSLYAAPTGYRADLAHAASVQRDGAVRRSGGGKRGAIAVYVEPWHADVEAVLELRKNHGKEEARARDLFTGMWCPTCSCDECATTNRGRCSVPTIVQTSWRIGERSIALQGCARSGGKALRTLPARRWMGFWTRKLRREYPTCHKDACNRKHNQQHVGPLRCSNLCTRSSSTWPPTKSRYATWLRLHCWRCVDHAADGQGTPTFNFGKLEVAVRLLRNLNHVIDGTYYPLEECRRSNLRHRPIGIGVQGLADVFQDMHWAFDAPEARTLNVQIFETVLFSIVESVALARRMGATYDSHEGSQLSQGTMQPDLWTRDPERHPPLDDVRHDWTQLRADLARHGAETHCSLRRCPPPLRRTSWEHRRLRTPNVQRHTRRVLCGEFAVVNERSCARSNA